MVNPQQPPPSNTRAPRANIRRGAAPQTSSAAAAAAAAASAAKTAGGASSSADPRAGLRRVVWTGVVAAITVTGALYGAGLKGQRDAYAERDRIVAMPDAERIAGLEDRRAELLRQRRPLEAKLSEIRARIAAERKKQQEQELENKGAGDGDQGSGPK